MQLLNKKHLEIIKIASKDDHRTALQGIYVEAGRTTVTDGHRLMSVHSYHTDTDEKLAPFIQWSPDKKPFVLPPVTVKEVLKNMPKKIRKGEEPSKIAIGLKKSHNGGPEIIACQANYSNGTETVEGEITATHFPKCEQVIPKIEDLNNPRKYTKTGISAKYLKEICALLETYDNNHLVTLHIARQDSENKPIVLTANDFDGTDAMAVIMPMKLNTPY